MYIFVRFFFMNLDIVKLASFPTSNTSKSWGLFLQITIVKSSHFLIRFLVRLKVSNSHLVHSRKRVDFIICLGVNEPN